MDDPKPQPFPETFKHDVLLNELKNERFHGTNIPEFFRQHNSFELRKIMIDMFSRSSDDFQIHPDAQAEWEELLAFLKKETNSRYSGSNYDGGNLFLDVLSAYVFKADDCLMLSALRFAISQLEGKYGVLIADDGKIIKIICGCINKREFNFQPQPRNPAQHELSKKYWLDGLFGLLPEIVTMLQIMLDCIYDCSDIMNRREAPRIKYGEADFVQVRRAIDIILRERHYNTDFLPAIEKMIILHKEKLRISRSSIKPWSIKDPDGNSLLFYPANQMILNEAARLLKQSQQDSIKNGAARRQGVMDEFSKRSAQLALS